MAKLPVASGDAVRRALEKVGWLFQRQNGSHMVLTKPGLFITLAIPRHHELSKGTLRRIIRDAGLDVEEFTQLLD
jgi:predicted RNA binding protein YcfA (HicA-like mRNA interferase family)